MSTNLASDVWMTTEDVATYTQRSKVTIWRHAAAGTLESSQGGRGRGRRYRREWVDAWVKSSPPLPVARKAAS